MNPSHDNLHDLATRYFHNEMSPTECEAFETQLADDQQAREALAEVVNLTESCRFALAEHAAPPSRVSWASYAGWAVAGLAMAVAVFVSVRAAIVARDGAIAEVSPGDTEMNNAALVSAWSEGVQWSDEEPLAEEEAFEDSQEADEIEFANDAPLWMLSAVQSAADNAMTEDGESTSGTQ